MPPKALNLNAIAGGTFAEIEAGPQGHTGNWRDGVALHKIQIPHVPAYRPRSQFTWKPKARCSQTPAGMLRRPSRRREHRPSAPRRRVARTTSGTDPPPGESDDDLLSAARAAA
jgi:hypothetical protein